METITFYDLKTRRKFRSNKYTIKTRMVKGNKRKFAVAKAPSGIMSWRIIG